MRALILAGLLLAPTAWAAGLYDGTYHGQLTADGNNATTCATIRRITAVAARNVRLIPTTPSRYWRRSTTSYSRR